MSNEIQLPPIPIEILGISDVETVETLLAREHEFIIKVKSIKEIHFEY